LQPQCPAYKELALVGHLHKERINQRKMHLVLRKRVEATNEDFPNVTLVSHQAAKISYQAHCKVFPREIQKQADKLRNISHQKIQVLENSI
jgi:hypothetical protein